MTTFTIHTAKTTLSKLIARAEAGEEIVLARGSQPVAKIIPIIAPPAKRHFGAYRGKVTVSEEFFAPLPDDELDPWDQ
ncbi:MAG TPA: type II toxin-antitoxin system Phd/YefM family antitoxin [Rhodospirillaceae bacterium]|nr:type II toxin-antitoxin system Phd/YefM family antitoxin [Rhodospirillaceae bacterium]